MAVDLLSYDHIDEDYIDMDVSTYSSLLCHSISSPTHPREFEFQMSSSSLERESTTSPADELFYKGKLLPLHLPPRLQMVKKLLQNSNSAYNNAFEEFYSTPLMTTVTTPTTTSTPFESCQASRELNSDEYFFECTTEVSGFTAENLKKSWTKKLKLIKRSSLGSKLKASRAYLKSLLGRSGCSDESSATATKVADEQSASKAEEPINKYVKAAKKTPFGKIRKDDSRMSTAGMGSFEKEKKTQDCAGLHRRSFSLAIKRHSTNKFLTSSSSSSGSSSSSSSKNSSQSNELQYLKRSSSVKTSESENSIQGAIAHCKQSQQLLRTRNNLSEVGF
ncbi:hypothetical protein CFOL_v3_20736 [Cephalotus follicularis]|uniref:Membrane-associated kinase regulator 4 n=1 Tax=Cephalotus follicularis TaxID=3775 RepID=A0A1Q3CAM0_CEPFO|nr:hypothetical protein CFOL_v3_20736 [Cephalotus follicularis]